MVRKRDREGSCADEAPQPLEKRAVRGSEGARFAGGTHSAGSLSGLGWGEHRLACAVTSSAGIPRSGATLKQVSAQAVAQPTRSCRCDAAHYAP